MGGMEFFYFIIEASKMASILIVIILAIRKLIKNRVSPMVIYFMWIIVILKLIVPYGPESKGSVYTFLSGTSEFEEIIKTTPVKDNEISKEENLNSNLKNYDNREVIITNDDTAINGFSMNNVLFIIWGIGVFIISSCGFISYFKLYKLKYHKECNEKYKKVLSDSLTLMNIKKNIRIIETDLVSSPSLCGAFFPKILMPKSIKEKVSNEELKYIFIHELCHFKNKDLLIHWITLVIRTIHWFNPLVHFAFNRMKSDCELACDYRALSYLKENENIKYGNTIINLMSIINGNNRVIGTTSIVIKKKDIKGRIIMISKNKKFGIKALTVGILLITFVGSIGLTSCVTSKEEKSSDKVLEEKTDIEQITEVVTRYAEAIDKGDFVKAAEETEGNILDYKLHHYPEEYVGEDTFGKLKNVEFVNDVDDKRKIIYFSFEKYNNKFVLIKVENEWKIQSIGVIVYEEEFVKDKEISEETTFAINTMNKYLEDNSYEVIVNGGLSSYITLPGSFEEIKMDVKIGEVLKNYNELSKKNGYDFSPYLGQEVYYMSATVEGKDNNVVMMLFKDKKIIGVWETKNTKEQGIDSLLPRVLGGMM